MSRVHSSKIPHRFSHLWMYLAREERRRRPNLFAHGSAALMTAEARLRQDQFFGSFPSVKQWQEKVTKDLASKGLSPTGRVLGGFVPRFLPVPRIPSVLPTMADRFKLNLPTAIDPNRQSAKSTDFGAAIRTAEHQRDKLIGSEALGWEPYFDSVGCERCRECGRVIDHRVEHKCPESQSDMYQAGQSADHFVTVRRAPRTSAVGDHAMEHDFTHVDGCDGCEARRRAKGEAAGDDRGAKSEAPGACSCDFSHPYVARQSHRSWCPAVEAPEALERVYGHSFFEVVVDAPKSEVLTCPLCRQCTEYHNMGACKFDPGIGKPRPKEWGDRWVDVKGRVRGSELSSVNTYTTDLVTSPKSDERRPVTVLVVDQPDGLNRWSAVRRVLMNERFAQLVVQKGTASVVTGDELSADGIVLTRALGDSVKASRRGPHGRGPKVKALPFPNAGGKGKRGKGKKGGKR